MKMEIIMKLIVGNVQMRAPACSTKVKQCESNKSGSIVKVGF